MFWKKKRTKQQQKKPKQTAPTIGASDHGLKLLEPWFQSLMTHVEEKKNQYNVFEIETASSSFDAKLISERIVKSLILQYFYLAS